MEVVAGKNVVCAGVEVTRIVPFVKVTANVTVARVAAMATYNAKNVMGKEEYK